MGFVADVVGSVWDGITSIFDGGSSYTPGPSENERHATKIANELANALLYNFIHIYPYTQ